MSTKSKPGIVLILTCAVAMILLFGGVISPLAHIHGLQSSGLQSSGNLGRLVWIATPPLFMLALFVLLVRVIFMQKD